VTAQLADNPVFVTASRYWQMSLAYLKSLPLNVWRNGLLVLSALWLCHSLAGFFWLLFPVPEMAQPTRFAEPASEKGATATGVQVDITKLQGLKLFGDAGDVSVEDLQPIESSSADIAVDEDAETTGLSLQLHGVISSENQQLARAIIDFGSDQALYRIGEEISKNRGVKLAKVMEQRVILDNNGKFESLWLYSEEDFKKSAGSRKKQHKVSRSSGDDRATKRVEPIKKSIAAAQIPKTISDVVRFSVHREDGKMVGYKVRPGRDQSLFEQVGLKSGDIVTNVNGREMTDPKQLRDVYQDLKTATEASLSVRRGEQEIPITIRVDN